MIFIHFLLGILLGIAYKNYFLFILGSVFPDIDHVYIIIKNRLFSSKKIIDSIKHETKYNIRYKTPFFHSLLGLIIFSLLIYIFSKQGAILFAFAYLMHLLIDWLDIDEKYFLYPLKIKFRGFLPIWSNAEKILTIILLIIIFGIFLFNLFPNIFNLFLGFF